MAKNKENVLLKTKKHLGVKYKKAVMSVIRCEAPVLILTGEAYDLYSLILHRYL